MSKVTTWPEEMPTRMALLYAQISRNTLVKYARLGFLHPVHEEPHPKGKLRFWLRTDLDRLLVLLCHSH